MDERNAQDVADAYVRTTLTFDTRVDAGFDAAQQRAKRWMTQELAAPLATTQTGDVSGTGWERLRAADTWTRVATKDLTQAAEKPTKGTATERIVQAAVVTTSKSSKKPKTTTTTLSLTLTRDSARDPWRISETQTY